ncbi:MFS transporter [Eubacteriales bacterium OttesenSCG-928-N13]|nr:MFS transporter [Eubacteriales bacterium OttesenSCG-928-N13]
MKLTPLHKAMLLTGIYGLFSNMIHPITPTLIESLGLPNYMFGLLFAAMATGTFITSTFWGRMADKRGRRLVLVVTFLGYAVAQLLLGYVQDAVAMTLVRLVGGLFTGGTMVCIMAMVIDASDERHRATQLMYLAAVQSVTGSLGFLLGGVLGTVSLMLVFWVHFAGLCLGAALSAIWVQDAKPGTASAASPKINLRLMRSMLPLSAILFLVGVAFANFGTYGFDNAFNYYLKNVLSFPSSINGIVKAVTGLLGLAANLIVNPWLLKRMQAGPALVLSTALCAATLVLVALITDVPLFLAVNVLFYVLNAMYVPMQQALAGQDKQLDLGFISGLYYSIRSLGMIAGSLTAGFVYEVNAKLPFVLAAAAFALAAAAAWFSYKAISKRTTE